MIAIPCNTATTNAIDYLRSKYSIPLIGIEPAIKPAALQSDTKKIGILATKGTLSSKLFKTTQEKFTQNIDTIEVVGTGIVELIEAGKTNTREMRNLLTRIVEPFMISGIDYLVLGCSHYPYIKYILEELLPKNVHIIDSGAAVARQILITLQDKNLQNMERIQGRHQLFSNADYSTLQELVGPKSNTTIQHLEF